MSHCAKCGSALAGNVCPNCGSAPAAPWRRFDKSLHATVWILIIGAIVAFFVSLGLLDRGWVLLLSLILSIGPLSVRYVAVRKKWGQFHQKDLAIMFRWSAFAMVGLVAIIIANRSLDRGTATKVDTYVLAKHSHSGKGGPDYTLVVGPSWRPGRNYESLGVGRDTFSRAYIGGTISLDLHKGFFRLPWYDNVRPDLTATGR